MQQVAKPFALLSKTAYRNGQTASIQIKWKSSYASATDKTCSVNPELYPDLPTRARLVGLKRLGIDTIDLLHLHRVGKNTPIKVTVGTMAELVKCVSLSFSLYSYQAYMEGMKHLGFSEAALSRTLAGSTPRVNCVKIVAYAPLGCGLLTGQYIRHHQFPKILKLVTGLQVLGTSHRATAVQYLAENIGTSSLRDKTPPVRPRADERPATHNAVERAHHETLDRRWCPR
ncbi:hypothetical protein GGX14DRAFT_632746 [Mycena pura]|uniref:NADP-dependent oxidoreductase domain-containing protein n=1 Tax=Mycena pura TaxID=153505 RepID=A0AAD6Y9L1_9AGAR|nr:hypothetical protein GGX14DRAFT_632746 [Mycena pura]